MLDDLVNININKSNRMNTGKTDSTFSYKLYGSAVTDSRSKASSFHVKRANLDVPSLQINSNYLTPSYAFTDRKSTVQDNNAKLAMSYAGRSDLLPPSSNYNPGTTDRGSYTYNEPKSASRVSNSGRKERVNQKEELTLILGRKRSEMASNRQSMEGSQNTDNYRRIMEKLDKKQKIIQELQKLCETKVSDSLRSNYGYEKGDYEVYSPVRAPRKNNNSNNSSGFALNTVPLQSTNKLEVPASSSALTQSLNFDTNRKDFESTFRISPEEGNSPVRKGSYIDKEVRKVDVEGIRGRKSYDQVRMTDEEISPVRKGSYGDRQRERAEVMRSKDSHRNTSNTYNRQENSSIGSQDLDYVRKKARVDGKKYSLFEVFGSDSYKPNDLTLSSKLTLPQTANLSEIYARRSKQFQDSKEQKQDSKEQKQSQQARKILESRRLRNESSLIQSGSRSISIYDFELTRSLGEGKFGQVYQAFHKETSSLYALKKISKKVIKQSMMVDQLLQQIKIQAYCNHENILKLYGFFDDSQHIYLILQYMEQGTLFSNLKQQKTLREVDVQLKIKNIAKALVYLHEEGIAHRDIKPENIVMSNNVCKLCDFGWAAICTDRRKTYCGTFDYVAPQILEGVEYDVSVDLWCLGVLAYELLVGKAPFYHISRKQTMKRIMKVQKMQYPTNVSPTAISFIDSLIRKNPEDRLNGQDILKHPFLTSASEVSI